MLRKRLYGTIFGSMVIDALNGIRSTSRRQASDEANDWLGFYGACERKKLAEEKRTAA
jgi:hypothetical protein